MQSSEDKFANYYEYYINHPMTKEGGRMYAHGGRARVWLNVVPVLLYLFLSKNKTIFKEQGGNFWKNLSLAIILIKANHDLFPR